MVDIGFRALAWATRRQGGDRRGRLLSMALRAVRSIRPLTSKHLAAALGLSLRGYQHFEAGGGQLNIDHVLKFAAATNSDPIGILVSVQIGRPDFAAHVAQNKAMFALMLSLQEFAEEAGEDVSRLDTAAYLSAYRAMFKDLAEQARAERERSDAWIAKNAARLGLTQRTEDDD
ncbi:MAG: hypothetical protein BGN86_15545 [Caulobacterales bacterium 68-7]|nr:MAG: hypothetical protein BGN86_15545 [Caulobacterales bacterium 68-7]